MVDLSKVPVLYTPSPSQQSQATILGKTLLSPLTWLPSNRDYLQDYSSQL